MLLEAWIEWGWPYVIAAAVVAWLTWQFLASIGDEWRRRHPPR